MRYLFSLLSLLSIVATQARAADLTVGFGQSVPATTIGNSYILPAGPTRVSGGEHFNFKFNGPKMISEIKISGFSSGKAGKTLVYNVTAVTGATSVALEGLFKFAKVTAGNPVNYQNLVMLPEATFVSVAPNQAIAQLDFLVEGFSNDDASIVIQITSADSLSVQEFIVTRTGPNSEQTVGGLINESNFAKFSASDLNKLMTAAVQPAVSDLNGKTFLCSSYTKLDKNKVDLKRRSFATLANGNLVSSSDLQGANIPWYVGSEGLQMNVDNFTGCGRFTTANILRRTGAGNLISEVVLDLEKYIAQCTAAGFDPDGTRAVEENSTFASVIAPKYRVDSYEFCRPVAN